jgi:TatD DNase family protein
MWTDTHCHLEAPELADGRDAIARHAREAGVSRVVIPAIGRQNFADVRQLAHRYPYCAYALGIHPVYIDTATEEDLEQMRALLEDGLADSRLVAIGEIGLDFYVPELKEGPLREKQEYFYTEQLKMARDFDLPVLLHSRRSVDIILKHLRQIGPPGGVAHAFNGSFQQAQAFIELGFALSFCGTFTYERAQHLRRLAAELPLDAIVIETDAPDLPPAWLEKRPNTPGQLPSIGAALASLRGITPKALAEATTRNAERVIPRLKNLLPEA